MLCQSLHACRGDVPKQFSSIPCPRPFPDAPYNPARHVASPPEHGSCSSEQAVLAGLGTAVRDQSPCLLLIMRQDMPTLISGRGRLRICIAGTTLLELLKPADLPNLAMADQNRSPGRPLLSANQTCGDARLQMQGLKISNTACA
jgi:hypothetical protein